MLFLLKPIDEKIIQQPLETVSKRNEVFQLTFTFTKKISPSDYQQSSNNNSIVTNFGNNVAVLSQVYNVIFKKVSLLLLFLVNPVPVPSFAQT